MSRDIGPKGIGYRVDVPRTLLVCTAWYTAQCTAWCTAWYTALWRLCSIPILRITILRLLFLVLIMEDNNRSIALRKKGKLEFSTYFWLYYTGTTSTIHLLSCQLSSLLAKLLTLTIL